MEVVRAKTLYFCFCTQVLGSASIHFRAQPTALTSSHTLEPTFAFRSSLSEVVKMESWASLFDQTFIHSVVSISEIVETPPNASSTSIDTARVSVDPVLPPF